MDEKSEPQRQTSDAFDKETQQAHTTRADTPGNDIADAEVEESIAAAPENPMVKIPSVPHGLRDPSVPGWRLAILITSICIGLFLSLLDTSIVATALYTIGDDFHDLERVNWVALAYTLSYVGFAVVFASLADVLGRRNTFLSASVIFIAFSLGCGFAQNMDQLIALRAFQGLGGAGLYALTMIIFPEVSPNAMAKWIGGVIGAVVAVAGVMGPVLGGIITHFTTWRWIFWINGPVGLISIVSFWFIWPPADQIRPYAAKPLKQIDFLGSTLLIAASVLVVFSFQEGGIGANRWKTAIFLVPIILGCVFWIALFGWEALVERRWSKSISSIFPLSLLKNRVYTAAMLATLCLGFPYFTAIYSLPIRFQVVNGKSVLLAGVYLLPMLGSAAIGSFLGGMISSKQNNTGPAMLVGSSFMIIGVALLSTLPNTVAVPAKTFGFEVFVGLGFGITVSSVSLLANLESPIQVHAVSQGIIAQMRVFGGSIGIAASTAILGVTQRKDLDGVVTQGQLATLRSVAASLTPEQWKAIRKTYSDSFNETMAVCAALASLCFLVTLLTLRKNREDIMEIRKRQFTVEMQRQASKNEPAVQVSAVESV